MSSKINLQTCEYACKSSIFQDNQLIYVKCSGKTAKYRVRSIKKEDCSLEEILPGDNFSSLGGRYQYNGEKIISLKLTPDVAP